MIVFIQKVNQTALLLFGAALGLQKKKYVISGLPLSYKKAFYKKLAKVNILNQLKILIFSFPPPNQFFPEES